MVQQIEIGNEVIIISSPYSSIKKGTKGKVKNIRFKEYGKRWTLYTLDTFPCSSFYIHEIRRQDELN